MPDKFPHPLPSASPSPHQAKPFTDERREFTRVPSNGRLTAQIERPNFLPFNAIVKDVSRSGICLLSPFPLIKGEVLTLHIDFGAGILRVKCDVARCQREEDDRYVIGVRFIQIQRGQFETVNYERHDVNRAHIAEVQQRLSDLPPH